MSVKTKQIKIGNTAIGGGNRIAVQSMCTVKTSDVQSTVNQIIGLEKAGCEIIRVSVLDEADAKAIKSIKERIHIPLVADIHFSHKLAVAAIENGCDKVRINPGNIGSESALKKVADCIKSHKIAVRVGSNTGSIEKEFLEKYGVNDIVISVKASDVPLTVKSYTLLSEKTSYPVHIGVTEAGTEEMAVVKSSTALGALLLNGIGDTLRVSITDDPVKEVYAGKRILRAVGMDRNYIDVVSCPTCGRCRWNSMELAKKVSAYTERFAKPLKIAVMGCVVNGPGEAKDCEIGIAGAEDYCVIFKKGEVYKRVSSQDAEREFFKEIDSIIND